MFGRAYQEADMTASIANDSATTQLVVRVHEMQTICETLRCQGKRIRLVPTMGALHAGHAALIEAAHSRETPTQWCNNSTNKTKKESHQQPLRHVCPFHNDKLGNHGFMPTPPTPPGILGDSKGRRNKKAAAAATEAKLNWRRNLSVSELNLGVARRKVHQWISSPVRQTFAKRQKAPQIVLIVSIFVNPTQFNCANDFATYPKSQEADLEFCKRLNVDYVFMPSINEMYPRLVGANDSMNCLVRPPKKLANCMEGSSRPGHFEGVLTVVNKLFNITKPHEAYFGDKDYQQLVLVRHMARDLMMDTIVDSVEVVREPHDLLPMSSRNERLSDLERQVAPMMVKILLDAKGALASAIQRADEEADYVIGDIQSLLFASSLATLAMNKDSNSLKLDYLELRCANDLSEVYFSEKFHQLECRDGCLERQAQENDKLGLEMRLLISVVVGKIRLLDNIKL